MVFKFVVVSKDEKILLNLTEDQINQINSVNEHKISFDYIRNNNLPLTICYNNVLKNIRSGKEHADTIIFLHGDVVFDLGHLLSMILEHQNEYNIMGLCGCDKINVSISPLNWFNGSKLSPNNRWGIVRHGEDNNNVTFYNQHSPNVIHHPVSCIDGLCIIFNKPAIISDIEFDEQFEYDHYDTDISFQALLKYNLSLGVIVEPTLFHYSIGMSITQEKFMESEAKFREKWKDFLN